MQWTQLSLDVPVEDATAVALSISVTPSQSIQIRTEAFDGLASTIALKLRRGVTMIDVHAAAHQALNELLELIDSRHGPFDHR